MTKNRTRTPVYLDPGMHPGLEVKGLTFKCDAFKHQNLTSKDAVDPYHIGIQMKRKELTKTFIMISD